MAVVQKKGDTRKAVFKTNFSLLNSTVELKVRDGSGSLVSTAGKVEIEDPYGGIVTWNHGGLLPQGTYTVELWITRDSVVYKAPTEGYATVRITEDLG